MALALVAEPETVDTSLSAYVALDKKVDGAEEDALVARWSFGKMMLAERIAYGSRQQLPDGRLVALSEATKKSRSELKYRAQFAEQYPTRLGVANALATHGSWFQIVKDGLVREPKEKAPPPTISPVEIFAALENHCLEDETLIRELADRGYGTTALMTSLRSFAVSVRNAQE